MLQILSITLISLGVVTGYGMCPGFSGYKNNPSYLKYLEGELVMVYTTSNYVIDCERGSWTACPDGGKRTATVKDASGCHKEIGNFDSSNPEYIQHTMRPVTTCADLKSTEVVKFKVIKRVKTCDNLCIFVALCRPSRNGIFVACQQAPRKVLLENLGVHLAKLISPSASVRTINQADCIFGNTCFTVVLKETETVG